MAEGETGPDGMPSRYVVMALVIVAGIGLLIGMEASAQSFEKNEDATGNGHDLVEEGSPTNATTVMDKFTVGYNISGATVRLSQPDAVFDETGDISLSIALQPGLQTRYRAVATETPWELRVRPNDVVFIWDSMNGQEFCNFDTNHESEDEISIGLTRNTDALTAQTVELRAWSSDGTQIHSEVCETGAAAQSTGYEELRIEEGSEVYDARFWVGVDTQAFEVADPSTDTGRNEAASNEEATWLMQAVDIPETSLDNGVVSVWTEQSSGQVTVFAQLSNETGQRVEPTNGINLTLERVREPLVEWWNTSEQSFQSALVRAAMQGVSTTLFKANFSASLFADNQIRLTARTQAEDSTGSIKHFFGTYDERIEATVQEDPEVSVLSDTAFHDFSGLTSLEWALFFAAGLIGAFLWSRSLDPVVETFGALLVVLGGLLLLGYGGAEGFGSVWQGTFAFSLVMTIAGLYMVVRVFFDKITNPRGEGEGR